MMTLRSVIAALTVAAFAAPAAQAEEPYLEFLQGLRMRGYNDYALMYLDTLADDANCPTEVKELVPYEKATTLLSMARGGQITNPDVKTRQLDQALGFLQEFITASPNHARAGEANTERARILLGKARVEVWQSRSPANKENRGEFQNKARTFVLQAREIFQTAHDQHKTTWEVFPKFIDKIEQPALFKQRKNAEVKYILAQLDLANCTYEEGQSHDENSDEFKAKLRDAASEYEEIHSRYRSQLGGLYARTWQGKCYEEQDDIQRALGIYKELLGHPGKSESMVRLQDQVRHFELICLNHKEREDYQLVIDKSTEWLSNAKGRKRYSQNSLGIRWEQILAMIALAEARDVKEADRRRLLTSSLTTVRIIKRFPGQYKDLATFKERDLMVKLQGDGALDEPEDFDTAFSIAQEMVTKKTKDLRDAVDTAKASGDKDALTKARQDLNNHVEEATRLLKIALKNADEETPVNDLNQARYYLAYMHLLGRRNYEAAILTEFVARNYGKDNPVQAQDSAYMSMAAYVQAFNDNLKARRTVDQKIDVAQMVGMAKLLTDNWPGSDRAMESRIQMGSVYAQLDRHEESASWFSQVPATASRFTEAQTRAGQSYWAAYVEAAQLDPAQRPTQEQLSGWMQSAEQHLRTGIEGAEKATPAATPAEDSLIAAKVSLVQILVSQGKYQDGVNLLVNDPHAVKAAIAVEDESKRPTDSSSIKSVSFASLAYQLLLRCYVGLGNEQLDNARNTMQQLEKIGSGGGAELTEIYRQLGEELKNELAQLKAAGKTDQFDQVRSSFEAFLDDMFAREQQTVNSLTWIGETNYGLAQGSSDDPASSAKYFERAGSAYQQIIDRGKADADFMDAGRLTAVKLRLVNCRRNQRDFEQAETLVKEIITENDKYLDAQLEANYVYQDWGMSGEGDSWKKLSLAMAGDKAKIWGWHTTSRRLQAQVESGRSDAIEKYEDKYYESKYNLAKCRFEYGKAQTGGKRKSTLESATRDITTFVAVVANFSDDWWPKFDTMYQEIQKAEGVIAPVALEKPKEYVPPAVSEKNANAKKSGKKKTKQKAQTEVASKDDSGPGMAIAIFGGVALLGLGIGGFMVVRGSKGSKRSSALSSDDEAPVVIAPPPTAPKKKKRAAGVRPGKPGAAGKPKSQTATGEKSKAKRPLTPEEKEKVLKQRAARAKAEQAKRKKPEQPPE